MSHNLGNKKLSTNNLFYYFGITATFLLGIGDNFQGTPAESVYYFMFSGFHFGYIIFGLALLTGIAHRDFRSCVMGIVCKNRTFVFISLLLSFWLVEATLINTQIYGGDIQDLLPCIRLIFFVFVTFYIAGFTKKFGPLGVIKPFVAGISLVVLERVVVAFTSPDAVVVANSLPVIRDPNVVGALAACGLSCCAVGLLYSANRFCMLAVGVLLIGSIFTFSKGTWVMDIFGCVACMSASYIRRRGQPGVKSGINSIRTLVVVTLVLFVFLNLENLIAYIQWKIFTTEDNQSVTERLNFLFAGLRLMLDNPIFGVGFRNYPVAERFYPELFPGTVDNAHNLFAQIGAIAGFPALVMICCLIIYPFFILKNKFTGAVYWELIFKVSVFIVYFIYANVQLQLIAQPPFWVFAGLVCGLNSLSYKSP